MTAVLLKMDSEKKATTRKVYSLKDLYFGCMVTINLCLQLDCSQYFIAHHVHSAFSISLVWKNFIKYRLSDFFICTLFRLDHQDK